MSKDIIHEVNSVGWNMTLGLINYILRKKFKHKCFWMKFRRTFLLQRMSRLTRMTLRMIYTNFRCIKGI